MILRLTACFLFLLILVSSAEARVFRSWSYAELLKMSEVVVIIEPLSSEKTKDQYSGHPYGHPLNHFTGLNTTFKVHAVLKGDVLPDKPFIVLHFAYSKDVTFICDGARFVTFFPGPLQFKKQVLKEDKAIGGVTVYQEAPVWLAFLKKREDGRYEPVTDPDDAVDSFRELHQPSFYIK